MAKKFLLLLLVLSALVHSNVLHGTAQSPEYLTYKQPTFGIYHLNTTGSLVSPYITTAINNSNYVYEFSFILHWIGNNYNILQFGADTKLTNGVNALYNGISLFNNKNVSTNDDLDHYFNTFRLQQDALNPKDNQIVATYIFTDPILITPAHNLYFYVQDNISSLTSIYEFFVRYQGYTVVNEQINNPTTQSQDWLTLLSEIWINGGLVGQVTIVLLLIAGSLLIWTTFKKLRQSV